MLFFSEVYSIFVKHDHIVKHILFLRNDKVFSQMINGFDSFLSSKVVYELIIINFFLHIPKIVCFHIDKYIYMPASIA